LGVGWCSPAVDTVSATLLGALARRMRMRNPCPMSRFRKAAAGVAVLSAVSLSVPAAAVAADAGLAILSFSDPDGVHLELTASLS